MLFNEEDCLLMDLSSTSDDQSSTSSSSSSDEAVKPGAVDLPHDFTLASQPIQLTPISDLNYSYYDEQDLFFISDADDSMSSYYPCSIYNDDSFLQGGPRKKSKRDDVYVSPVSACAIAQPFDFFHATPSPPLLYFSKEAFAVPDTSRFYHQSTILSQRMRQSEESRQKVAEHRKEFAHVYASVQNPETSLFTTSKIASEYQASREALLSSLYQVMNESSSPTSLISPS